MWEETVVANVTFHISTSVYMLGQTTKNVSQDSQSSLQDSNRAVLVCEAGMLTSATYRSGCLSLILL
jgi:hypothetical protein